MGQLSFGEILETTGTAPFYATYENGLDDGYRDGYLDGVADTEKKYAAESETTGDPRNYEAKRKGQAGEDRPQWAWESVSEVLGGILSWYPGFNSRV